MSEPKVPRVKIFGGAHWHEVCMPKDVEQLEASHAELLEALKQIMEQTDGRNHSVIGIDRAYSIARAAIAKAEGGES